MTYKVLSPAKFTYQRMWKKFLHGHTIKNINMPKIELDLDYLCDSRNKAEIEQNIKNRKGIGNISRVIELYTELQKENVSHENKIRLMEELEYEASQIPNKSSPVVANYGSEPRIIKVTGTKSVFNFKPKEFANITSRLHLMRSENLSNFSGHKSYYFMGQLAELEHALVQFAVQNLLARDFQLVSVPDILTAKIIESCGMNVHGDRTQVYKLDPELYGQDLCLSGTSEMALAALVMNRTFRAEELPHRLAAVSRCYRAETSKLSEEKGVYRVHQFTKVEMFGVTTRESSGEFMDGLQQFEEQMFSSLGLHFQTLDMPPHELGAPAFRKYDIEAWMPGRKMYGEVSSCSDCTDYQARRLNIKYFPDNSSVPLHAHTVNGTACAVPRMLLALLETHQQADGTVAIPEPLQRYMQGKTIIAPNDNIPNMKYIKSKHKSRH